MKKIYLETRVCILGLLFFISAFFTVVLSLLIDTCRISSFLWLLVPVAVFAAEACISWKWIYVPYCHSKHMLALFASGYSLTGISDEKNPLSREMEMAQTKVTELLNTDQMMNLSKRQAQFLVLQNQINPHFLYNTLEGIRSEALIAGLASVANMAEALSTFFRYTISHVENLVTLRMELDNTRNYFFIQQYRFGRRLHLKIDIDDDDQEQVLKYRIPKLTLQPIVENSIIHGLECKVAEGNLNIKIITTEARLLITVSDDGAGMDENTLERIRNRLTFRSFNYVSNAEKEQHSGIALENVNNRIKLLFGEEYGLSVDSTPGVGTDVHISLPRTSEDSL